MTAPGGAWAEAHVDVELRFEDLDQELIRRLDRSSQIAQRAVNRNLDKIAAGARRSFEKIGDAYDRQMDRIEKRTAKGVATINRHLGRIDRNVDVAVDVRMTGASSKDLRSTASALRRLQQDAGNIACRIDIQIHSMAEIRELAEALRRLPNRVDVDVNVDRHGTTARAVRSLGGLGSILGGVGSSVARFGSTALGMVGTLGKLMAIAGAATVAIGGMVPMVGALASGLVALGGAAGTVAVGGLFALAATGGMLATALSGVGEAAKNMFDPEKAADFEKGLAELAPSAQSAIRAFQKLGKTYGDVVKPAVQQRFFQGLDKEIAGLTQFMGPLRKSLVGVAAGFNDGANRALNFINTAKGASMIKDLLRDSGTMASDLGNFITRLIPGFAALGAAATGVLAPMSEGIGDIAGEWSRRMTEMQQTGKLQEKMRGFLDTAKQIGQALATVGSIIGGIFSAAKAAGDGNPLGNFQDTLDSIDEWVHGPGAQALTSFFEATGQAMSTLMPIILQIAGIIGGQVAPMIAELITAIGPALSDIVAGIGQGIAPVIPILGQLIAGVVQILGPVITSLAQALGPVLVAIGTAIGGLLESLSPLIQPLVDLFAALGPILAQVATMLGGVLSQAIEMMMPYWEALISVVSSIMDALTPLIPVIGTLLAGVFSALSPVIEVFADVLTQVASVIAGALGSAIKAILPALESMAPVFAQIGEALGQFAGMLGDVLVQAVEMVAPLLPQIVDAFMQLLTALMPLIPILLDLAMTCLQPIIGMLPSLISIMIAVLPIIVQLATLFATLVTAIMPVINVLAKVIGFFVNLLGTIVGFVAKALAVVVGWVASIVAGFIGMVTTVVSTVSGWISDVLGFFGDLASKAISFVTDMWGRVTTGFSDGVGKAVDFVKELPGKIMGAFADAGKWLWDAGKKIIGGLIDGIKSMLASLGNAIVSIFPTIIQGPVRRVLGLALGGMIPQLAAGGVLDALGGGEITGATTTIRPGGFIVNARQTRKNKGLLKALAPQGRVLSGPGTGTSDSITGTHNGKPIARVSRGEYYVPPQVARRMLPQLMAINAGRRIRALASGGKVPYGLPAGTNTGGYGSSGDIFPEWVHDIEKRFNVKASTYPGHQESDGKNKGIDWTGSVPDMQKFAEYLLGIKGDLEQVIWMNPDTGEQIGVADGQRVGPGTDRPGYYRNDWGDHQNHVHTRQSYSFGDTTGSGKGIDDTTGSLSSSSGLGGSGGTPIGSGIGTSGTGTGSGASWGNSGGESRANNAVDAKRAGLTPVWVENWPASIGGSSSGTGSLDTGSSTTGDLSTAGTTDTVGEPQKVTASSSKKDVAAAIYAHARKRGYSHEEALAIVSTAIQESNLDAKASGGGGAWHGYFQQDSSYANRDDPEGNITGFLDRLDEKTKSDPDSDIWKRIFWLQQRPGESTADAAYGNGRQAYLDEIQSKQGEAKELVGKVPVTPQGTVPVTVTNNDTIGGDLSTGKNTTTTPSTTTTTTGQQPASASMPYGKARADQWLSEQNLGASLQDVGVAGLKETFGEVGALIGVESFVERGIDEMVAYLRQIAAKDPKTEFKWADVVNINGASPEQTKTKTTEGMTAVMDTYRQG